MTDERIRCCLDLQETDASLAQIERQMAHLATRHTQLEERRKRLRRQIQAIAQGEVIR